MGDCRQVGNRLYRERFSKLRYGTIIDASVPPHFVALLHNRVIRLYHSPPLALLSLGAGICEQSPPPVAYVKQAGILAAPVPLTSGYLRVNVD